MASHHLFRSRRFLPLFITQFLGALNDNFFKNAVIILVTYRTADEAGFSAQTLVTMTAALFIFPFIIFCATAGKLADKFDKSKIARIIKYAEVGCMLLASFGFYFHQVGFLFVVLFCMGVHSAFFSPVKYALLPDLLKESELMEGNAFIEGITFIAILAGTIAGGILVLRPDGEIVVSLGIVSIAVLGVISSLFIPPATMRDPTVTIRLNVAQETWDIVAYVFRRPPLAKSILANSWFWFVCMTFLTLFPAYIREIIGADEHVVTLFLTSFSVGIGVGAFACGLLQSGGVSIRFVPLSCLGMSMFIFDLYLASPHGLSVYQGTLLPLSLFLKTANGWRMVFDLFMLAISGGFYVVPLYAIIQKQSEPRHRAQVMACNNVISGFFMVMSASFAQALYLLHFSVAVVFVLVGIMNLAVAVVLSTRPGKLA